MLVAVLLPAVALALWVLRGGAAKDDPVFMSISHAHARTLRTTPGSVGAWDDLARWLVEQDEPHASGDAQWIGALLAGEGDVGQGPRAPVALIERLGIEEAAWLVAFAEKAQLAGSPRVAVGFIQRARFVSADPLGWSRELASARAAVLLAASGDRAAIPQHWLDLGDQLALAAEPSPAGAAWTIAALLGAADKIGTIPPDAPAAIVGLLQRAGSTGEAWRMKLAELAERRGLASIASALDVKH